MEKQGIVIPSINIIYAIVHILFDMKHKEKKNTHIHILPHTYPTAVSVFACECFLFSSDLQFLLCLTCTPIMRKCSIFVVDICYPLGFSMFAS